MRKTPPWLDDTIAPNGRSVRENFTAWFRHGKVLDGTSPQVVFHGTLKDFAEFRPEMTFDGGFHFGTATAANQRTDDLRDGSDAFPVHLMPVYLAIQNPMRTTDPWEYGDGWAERIALAKAKGHDGIVYRNEREDAGRDSWIAFYPHQIKSAIGNSGNYDPTDQCIADTDEAPAPAKRYCPAP